MTDETRQALDEIKQRIIAQMNAEDEAPLRSPVEMGLHNGAILAYATTLRIIHDVRSALGDEAGAERN